MEPTSNDSTFDEAFKIITSNKSKANSLQKLFLNNNKYDKDLNSKTIQFLNEFEYDLKTLYDILRDLKLSIHDIHNKNDNIKKEDENKNNQKDLNLNNYTKNKKYNFDIKNNFENNNGRVNKTYVMTSNDNNFKNNSNINDYYINSYPRQDLYDRRLSRSMSCQSYLGNFDSNYNGFDFLNNDNNNLNPYNKRNGLEYRNYIDNNQFPNNILSNDKHFNFHKKFDNNNLNGSLPKDKTLKLNFDYDAYLTDYSLNRTYKNDLNNSSSNNDNMNNNLNNSKQNLNLSDLNNDNNLPNDFNNNIYNPSIISNKNNNNKIPNNNNYIINSNNNNNENENDNIIEVNENDNDNIFTFSEQKRNDPGLNEYNKISVPNNQPNNNLNIYDNYNKNKDFNNNNNNMGNIGNINNQNKIGMDNYDFNKNNKYNYIDNKDKNLPNNILNNIDNNNNNQLNPNDLNTENNINIIGQKIPINQNQQYNYNIQRNHKFDKNNTENENENRENNDINDNNDNNDNNDDDLEKEKKEIIKSIIAEIFQDTNKLDLLKKELGDDIGEKLLSGDISEEKLYNIAEILKNYQLKNSQMKNKHYFTTKKYNQPYDKILLKESLDDKRYNYREFPRGWASTKDYFINNGSTFIKNNKRKKYLK